MKSHGLSGDCALCVFMSSETYRSLHDPATKSYALTTRELADMFDLEESRSPPKKNTLGSEAMRFKVYRVAEYSCVHNMDAEDTVELFLECEVLRFLNHEIPRWQDLESTVEEIDEFISNREKPATTKG